MSINAEFHAQFDATKPKKIKLVLFQLIDKNVSLITKQKYIYLQINSVKAAMLHYQFMNYHIESRMQVGRVNLPRVKQH